MVRMQQQHNNNNNNKRKQQQQRGFKNNPNFGPNVANAYSYSGNYQAPYTVKNKMNNCKINVGKYRRQCNKNIQCS